MEFEEKKVQYVDKQIDKNKDLLLANFGPEGIRRSKFKEKLILDILGNMTGQKNDNVRLFFWRLGMVYERDKQFKTFTKDELAQFINEEHAYILAKVLIEEDK